MINLHHVRLLATVVKCEEITFKQVLQYSACNEGTIVSQLQVLQKHKFIKRRQERHGINYTFYSATESGKSLVKLINEAATVVMNR